MKRLFALLLAAAMVLGMLPTAFATRSSQDPYDKVLTEEDYILADLMWEEVNAKEEAMMAKKAPVSKTVEALISTVTASPYYEEDSLIRNGDHFFWETTDGIACGYSPRLSATAREATPIEGYDVATASTVLTDSYATRKNTPGGRDVYVIQPYYGLDTEFTEQYVTEAKHIAQKTGGTATVYRTTDATIDNVARALEQGAVVIFDSHGDTDYVNPGNKDDFVSRANTSYLCLQTGTGLTLNDMQKVSGPFGEYYHAYYSHSYGSMTYYCVDGTAIANHMKTPSQSAFLWMALCLSMATDGLHKPLMEKGLAVAYGYTQSVTFDYDYDWEKVFWGQMLNGKTVAQAIATMKDEVGLWDWCHAKDYDTIEEARKEYCAFPIVVSEQDTYPGQGKVENLQTVYSAWSLCTHQYSTTAVVPATCTEGGYTAYTCSLCGNAYTGNIMAPKGHTFVSTVTAPTCETQGYTTYTCSTCNHSYTDDMIPATGHHYTETAYAPTCSVEGHILYRCTLCTSSYTVSLEPAFGHNYEEGYCTTCGRPDLPENPFVDVDEAAYFGYPVLWALKMGITTGTTATTFAPENPCTRGQVVTFLWRSCGSPEPETMDNPFSDIREKDYYYKAVLWAVEQGITNGTGKGKFSPDSPCTRGQVATFLWRAQEQPAPTDSTTPFSDIAEGDYYYSAVLWAVEQSITQGTGKGKFSPDNTCTRGQIVTFLYRAIA